MYKTSIMKTAIKLSAIIVIAGVTFSACAPKITAEKSTRATEKNSVAPSIASIPEGEKTYKLSCGRCHKLEDPAEFTKKEWGPIMRSMAKKANLNEVEKQNVLAYVLSHSK